MKQINVNHDSGSEKMESLLEVLLDFEKKKTDYYRSEINKYPEGCLHIISVKEKAYFHQQHLSCG